MKRWICVLFFPSVVGYGADTLFTNPHYPPLVYEGGEYHFYKYTPKYVPENLLHCFKLLGTADQKILDRFKKRTTEEVIERGMFDRGYRLRKEFCLEGFSSFTLYFHKQGIYYPYAMQTYILLAFHQYLNGERIHWYTNKQLSLEERQQENKAWKKRTRQLFQEPKEDAVIIESEPPVTTFEDMFFQW